MEDQEQFSTKQASRSTILAKWSGLGLIILSFGLYAILVALPFVPLSVEIKLILSPALILLGEGTFWVGGFLVGKDLLARFKFKDRFDPRSWFRRSK